MKPGPDFPTECELCGKDPADGQATTHHESGDVIRLCHDDGPVDGDRTCYQKWQPSPTLTGEQDFFNNNNREDRK